MRTVIELRRPLGDPHRAHQAERDVAGQNSGAPGRSPSDLRGQGAAVRTDRSSGQTRLRAGACELRWCEIGMDSEIRCLRLGICESSSFLVETIFGMPSLCAIGHWWVPMLWDGF